MLRVQVHTAFTVSRRLHCPANCLTCGKAAPHQNFQVRSTARPDMRLPSLFKETTAL